MTKSDFEMLLEKDVKTSVWIQPFGAQEGDEIKMSVPLIRRYIAVPAWDKQKQEEIQPSDEECVKFLMLCNARRLNPFEGDAYMIPFYDTGTGKHKWSLITAHSAFLKRAELHPHYDGMESGVIVQRGNDVLDLPGDFRLDSDKLLGGWSIVHNKNHKHASVKRVKLSTYVKGFGVWTKDPEGMICKVAEAQNVRDSFPTLIGGMYLREEIESDDFSRLINQEPVKRPAIPDMTTAPIGTTEPEKPKRRRPTMVEEPLDPPKPVEQPKGEQANPEVTPPAISASPPSTATPEPPEAELLRMAAANAVPIEQLVKYMKAEGWIVTKRGQTKISEVSPIKLNMLTGYWKKDLAVITKKMLEAA